MESSEQTERRAAEWLSRRDSDTWDDRDQVELDRWLSESTANMVAYIRLETVWRRADRLQALGAGLPSGKVPKPEEFNLSPFFGEPVEIASPPYRVSPAWATAVSVCLVLLVASAWYLWPSSPDYHTSVGGLASIDMPDGSVVTLNTDSAIRVELTPQRRQVRLDQGEVFFKVAKDSQRPFVVLAGDKRVTAVGTQFSLRRLDKDIRVLVTEGAVRIEQAASLTSRQSKPLSLVSAGKLASTQGDAILVQPEPPAKVEESLSWRSGYLIFREDTLSRAVAEFNRYNSRKIVIQDPAVGSIRLSGKFRATENEAFVRLLEGGFPIRAQRNVENIILTSSPVP